MELVLLVLALVVAIFGVWITWWPPKAARVREALGEAEPSLYFTVGSYGGPGGYGFGINLQNRGTTAAHNLAVYLPDIHGPAWQASQLAPGATPYIEISLQLNAPVRTRQMQGLTARLVYHDRFGREFSVSLPLVQQRRDAGFYDIGAGGEQPTVVRPATRFRELWRLRKIG